MFSEITPKVIGAAYPERIAFPASYVLTPLLRLLYSAGLVRQPVRQSAVVGCCGSNRKLRRRGHRASSLEELRTLVLEGGHFIPQKHQKILLNLFDLEDDHRG